MNDPHVAVMKYRLVVADSFEFRDPPDVEVDVPQFGGRLSKGLLTLEPRQHFAAESEVKPIADAFVLAWEIDDGLRYDRPRFHFGFERSEIIDRHPTPGALVGHIHAFSTFTGTLTSIALAYPIFPHDFVITPEVKKLWDRFSKYLAGGESLPNMAYCCLTLLEGKKGGRKAAATKYQIQYAVLDKLGELSSERGDNLTARKITPRTSPFSEKERNWTESAIKTIIRHLATRSAGTRLTMADLPPL
jgi:hypothetical protein